MIVFNAIVKNNFTASRIIETVKYLASGFKS